MTRSQPASDAIALAFGAHVTKLKAIHGSAEEDSSDQLDMQRKRNTELGLDPEFDRAGLHGLKRLAG